MTQVMTVIWGDSNGAQQLRTIETQAGASSRTAAIQVYNHAAPSQTSEGPPVYPGVPPVVGVYPSAESVAYLRFADAAGFVAVLALPAPDTSIFLADGVTVDPLAIGGIIVAATASLVTAAGNLVTTFVGGSLGQGRVTQ